MGENNMDSWINSDQNDNKPKPDAWAALLEHNPPPSELTPQWVNEDKPEIVPTEEQAFRGFFLQKGHRSAPNFLRLFTLDQFKAEFGMLFDSMESGQPLDLNHPLLVQFVQEQFANDDHLEIPEPFEAMNTATEFWELGFRRRLQGVLKAALTWK
jgi:hypothetical protein